MHSSIFVASSGFRKLATCVSWAVVNGIRSGRRRQVSLYLVQQSNFVPGNGNGLHCFKAKSGQTCGNLSTFVARHVVSAGGMRSSVL